MTPLFYRFWKNLAGCFRGANLLWHALAIALTFVLVLSGFDWFYYSHTRNDSVLWAALPAVVLGGVVPLFGLLVLFAVGKIRKSRAMVKAALTLGQAALIGYLISTAYKAFTGRAHPEFFTAVGDITRDFRFGFDDGGIFWGWPSSHTTVAFAMALALIALYPHSKPARLWALPYAFYIGIGVSVSIHWFSDFVAGAIIGSVVGITVGRSFREKSV